MLSQTRVDPPARHDGGLDHPVRMGAQARWRGRGGGKSVVTLVIGFLRQLIANPLIVGILPRAAWRGLSGLVIPDDRSIG
jgi:hypothetical protein